MTFRLYPIRLTRNSWKIPLYCVHKCDDNCSYEMSQSPNNNPKSFVEQNEILGGGGTCKKNGFFA